MIQSSHCCENHTPCLKVTNAGLQRNTWGQQLLSLGQKSVQQGQSELKIRGGKVWWAPHRIKSSHIYTYIFKKKREVEQTRADLVLTCQREGLVRRHRRQIFEDVDQLTERQTSDHITQWRVEHRKRLSGKKKKCNCKRPLFY